MSHHSNDKKPRSNDKGKSGESGQRNPSTSQPLRDSKDKGVAKNWIDKDKMQKEIDNSIEPAKENPISKQITDYLPKINPTTNKPDESTNFAEEINAQQASLQNLVTELQESDRALMETHAELNSALHKSLTGNIDKQAWDYDFSKNMEKELKYEEQIVTKEKEIDDAIRELRRVYLKGAVNLALNKPSEEQIKKDNTVLRDYKVSMKRFVSCKETLLGCASFSVDDRSNPHFRNVTAIHECDIVRDKLIGKSTNVHEGTYLNTKVAIKKFSDSISKERLQILKDMECHKNIIALRGVLVTEGLGTTILMQLGENGSLKEAFESNSFVFRFSRKIQWMRQLGQAMEWIHERSKPILHLRLHPSNLLLSSDFHIKIGDFGLGFVQPNVGQLVGNIKPFFTAPELLGSNNDDEIERNSTVAADIYSYGTCLWYILTEKKNKWKNMSFDQAKEFLFTKDKNSGILPSSVDPALNKLIFDCCSKSPNERPQSFAVILDHPWKKYLNHAVAGGGTNVVNDIWEHALKEGAIIKERGGNDVFFLDLAAAYHDKFGMKQQTHDQIKRDENWRCMAIFLEVQHFHDRPEVSTVKEENWQRFVHFFKPIEEDETNSTLAKFTSLCKNDWYFGRQDKKAARLILVAAKSFEKESKSLFKKKKPNVFIIRESSASATGDKETKGTNLKANVNCKFSITYYDSSIKVDNSFNKLEVIHSRLEGVNNVDQLISLVNSQYNSKHGFEPCNSAQREFKACFGSRQEQVTGYEVADLSGKEKEDNVQYEDQVIISYIQ